MPHHLLLMVVGLVVLSCLQVATSRKLADNSGSTTSDGNKLITFAEDIECPERFKGVEFILLSVGSHGGYAQDMTCSNLLQSLSATKTQIEIITHEGPYGGHLHKDKRTAKQQLVPRWLERNCIADETVILFVDSIDTLIQLNAKEIMARYVEMGRPELLASASTAAWPWPRAWDPLFPDPPFGLPDKFLNSGAFIGRARAIKKYMLDASDYFSGIKTNHSKIPDICYDVKVELAYPFDASFGPFRFSEDQGLMGCTYAQGNPYGIVLDHLSRAFLSTHYCEKYLVPLNSTLDQSRRLLLDTRTGSIPAVLHFHGAEKRQRLTMVKEMVWYSSLATLNSTFYDSPLIIDDEPTTVKQYCQSFYLPNESRMHYTRHV